MDLIHMKAPVYAVEMSISARLRLGIVGGRRFLLVPTRPCSHPTFATVLHSSRISMSCAL